MLGSRITNLKKRLRNNQDLRVYQNNALRGLNYEILIRYYIVSMAKVLPSAGKADADDGKVTADGNKEARGIET